MHEAQLVVFELQENRYALDIGSVQEILRVTDITSVPNMPDWMRGVINLRGKVVPVISLRRRLDLDDREVGQETRIILVTNAEQVFGLIVDRVLEVNTYTQDQVESPEQAGLKGGMLKGIVKKGDVLWMLLDLESLSYTATA